MEQQIQSLLFSVNSNTGLPYARNLLEVADGQGTRVWQDVFQTISTQSVISNSPIGYLPSTFLQIYGAASSISTIVATSYSTLSTQIGQGGIPGSITGYQLQSTVRWVQGGSKYISTADLVSTMTPFFNGSLSYMSNIQSTVIGLGSAGYLSSPTLYSTVTGITGRQISTTTGLGSAGYVSSLSLESTFRNLGSAGYVSSLSLQSTLNGLIYPGSVAGGNLGVVVSGGTDPSLVQFDTIVNNYLTSNNYFNETNAAFYNVAFGSNIPSTTLGLISSLGSLGYVSTPTLLSTSQGILAAKQNIFIDRAGGMSIYGSQVYISSVAAITFLSSFVDSTITYKGANGNITGITTNNTDLGFSTVNLQLDKFSSFITPQSRITVEVYPTFQFDSITSGAPNSVIFPMSTFVQYGNSYLNCIHETKVAGVNATNGYSNIFQQPLKISIPGSNVAGLYENPYTLTHFLPNAISYNTNIGFRSERVNTFFASTNSYFLTVQNLSF